MDRTPAQLLDDEFKSACPGGGLAPSSPALEPEQFEAPRRLFCMLRKKPEKPLKLQTILNNPQANLSSLFLAARAGDERGIQQFVEKTVNYSCWLNVLDDSGFAPLHHAARFNHVKAVTCLLRNGAKKDVRGKDDVTPLHVATRYNSVEVVKILVKEGVDVNSPTACGSTALSLASRRSNTTVVEILLSQSLINVNAKDYNDDTPLHQACAYGGYEVAEMLLRRSADTEAVNADHRTPMHSAVSLRGCRKTVQLLIAEVESRNKNATAYVNKQDLQENTSLHLAAQNGFTDIVEQLKEKQANIHAVTVDHQTPLHLACMAGHAETVRKLISYGAKVNAVDRDAKTPMHGAASNDHSEVVKVLLENGADMNKLDNDSKTPLLAAVAFGHVDTAMFLLDSGADVTARDKNLKSCLHFALESQAFETFRMLMENGGDKLANKGDINDAMPVHYAAILPTTEGLEILAEHGCHLNPKNSAEATPLLLAVEHRRLSCVELLCRIAPIQLNDVDGRGRTALHLAAVSGGRKIAQFLLRCGARLSARDEARRSPLHYAAANGSEKVLEDMIRHNAALDDTDHKNNTPLHLAVSNAHAQIVRVLLDAGADVLKRNDEGHTCLDLAIENGDSDVALAIVKHKRGRSILFYRGVDGQKPMEKLIEVLPDVAEHVMDQSIQRSKLPRRHFDYSVTYDFRLLDPGPDDESAIMGQRFFAPDTMVKHKRERLLRHPLSQKLIKSKWASFGRLVYYLNFLVYLVFLLSYTVYLMVLREQYTVASWEFHEANNFTFFSEHCQHLLYGPIGDTIYGNDPTNMTALYKEAMLASFKEKHDHKHHRHGNGDKPGVLIVIFTSSAQLLKELLQLMFLRLDYFKDMTNLIEWVLYGCCLMVSVPSISTFDFFSCTIYAPEFWYVATVGAFLAWVNLCLFLRRFGEIGLYVSMMFDVLRTVIKVTLMFFVLLFAFGMVFYLMLKEQKPFSTPELSILKVIVMTIGEMDYTDVFVGAEDEVNDSTGAPQLPLPELSRVFFIIFCFIMPIIFMNLLVGLAVGDIDSIQQSALLRKISMQVDFVSEIEERNPRAFTRLFYKPKIVIKPNQKKMNWCLAWFKRQLKRDKKSCRDSSDDEAEHRDQSKEEEMMAKFQSDLKKQKLKMKSIHEAMLELQHLVRGVADAMDVGTDNTSTSEQQLDAEFPSVQREPEDFLRNMLLTLTNPSAQE